MSFQQVAWDAWYATAPAEVRDIKTLLAHLAFTCEETMALCFWNIHSFDCCSHARRVHSHRDHNAPQLQLAEG